MGIFSSKPILEGYQEKIKEFAKVPTSADSYNKIITMMFDDNKWNMGRVLTWFSFTRAVRDRLPVCEHRKLNEYVMVWFPLLKGKLPNHEKTIDEMETQWIRGNWQLLSIQHQTEL